MSPEQAEGKPVDPRSDLFSLGVLLYEMATGERPFKGDTGVSVLSSILRDTPRPISDLNPHVPRELARIVKRCLVKDREHRCQTAKDLRNELEDLKGELDSGELAAQGVVPRRAAGWRRVRWAVAVGAAVVIVGVAAGLLVRRAGRVPPATPAAHVDAAFTQLTTRAGWEQHPSLSPDGRWIVYQSDTSGNADIYLQGVGGQVPINLTADSAAADTQPAFSPDGEQIAFRSARDEGGIFVMGRTGESARRLTDVGFDPAWSPTGDALVVATEGASDPYSRASVSQLWVIQVATGARQRISEGDAVQPAWSPHGQRIAYWASSLGPGQRDLWTIPATGSPAVAVTHDAAVDWSPAWSPDGAYLYFASDRSGTQNLWRVPMDEGSGRVLGSPEPVTTPSAFVGRPSLSAQGDRIAYESWVGAMNVQKAAFDPVKETVTGTPVAVTKVSGRFFLYPDVSPDGQWVTFCSTYSQEDIFVSRPDGTGFRQLTNDAALDRIPRWSPDGTRIAFQSTRSGNYNIWTINRDGSNLQPLTAISDPEIRMPVWSPDGSHMVVGVRRPGFKLIIFETAKPWTGQPAEALKPPAWLRPGQQLFVRSWSPDGRWLAGSVTEGGGIFRYSLTSQTYERLTDVGFSPVWLNDNRRLLFDASDKLFLLDSQSKKSHEVLAVAGEQLFRPRPSWDNRLIYFLSQRMESDIWVATLKRED